MASVSRSFMPADEMQLYAKMNWSYKNVSLPRSAAATAAPASITTGSSLNNSTFDGFNKKRANYIDPNPH